ncbi:MAG TPA: DUF6285 domain-containing protein [Pseudomonadales bacterium]|nr:DUF6285 domain-containing protein [Pseudomonadales bacterium]
MQDRPHAIEILQVLGDFLEDQLLPELDGPLRYRTLVALNLTRILQRESRLGTAYLLRERDRLCRVLDLGSEDLLPGSLQDQVEDLNQQLVTELEDADVSPEFEAAAWEALFMVTKEKLDIVRPGYADYTAEGELS